MSPSFHTRDYLLVNKLSYRIGEPKRGDIVVFKFPGNLSINYVKRIIGLPGDHVIIADGRVKVTNPQHPNGVLLDEPYLAAGVVTAPLDGSQTSDNIVP